MASPLLVRGCRSEAGADHGRGRLVLKIDAIDRAADQLDLALAMGELHRFDPTFAAPCAAAARTAPWPGLLALK